jgi:hypothetical protein
MYIATTLGHQQPPGPVADPLLHPLDQAVGHAGHFHQRAGQHEERYGEQDVAVDAGLIRRRNGHQRCIAGHHEIQYPAQPQHDRDRCSGKESGHQYRYDEQEGILLDCPDIVTIPQSDRQGGDDRCRDQAAEQSAAPVPRHLFQAVDAQQDEADTEPDGEIAVVEAQDRRVVFKFGPEECRK